MNKDHILKAVFVPVAAGQFLPYWFFWLLLPLLLLAFIILLIVWLYRRRKKEKEAENFLSGWIARYYGYNLSNKT